MRVFLYEWVTGGGLAGVAGRLPESLLREGLAMVQAVAADLLQTPGYRVTLMGDLRVPQLAAGGGEVGWIDSRSEHDIQFAQAAQSADATILIAPETDQALFVAVQAAEKYGARLASPGSALVAVVSDKHETAERLIAAGVPAPLGRVLDSDASLPGGFPYPAVVKPLDGAGSQDCYVVASSLDRPPAYAFPRRIEPIVPGLPASVGILVGNGEMITLPPCRQVLSSDGRLQYLGGACPLPGPLAERASGLARRAVEALPPGVGFIGVDLVLGPDPSGLGDRVIEVNPRLTTSFVGLRYLCQDGLAAAMVETALGRPRRPTFSRRSIEFDSAGMVSFLDDGRSA
ncbi:carbamoyl phosphate synthase-like protein [Pirellulimonas nuda]|uniref:Carbamoyl phosphate synthase-like protein n=1 Tax=Pirellulimonas nuda TaxID=2528009 RepID=A0A518DB80_9BACT|nr:ATP-grasp domain-containing protein [Pirellulimonas nuda]QDU88745.1 carbamoyl phosphate synthase-like protein [Pirellulimonas nuda]